MPLLAGVVWIVGVLILGRLSRRSNDATLIAIFGAFALSALGAIVLALTTTQSAPQPGTAIFTLVLLIAGSSLQLILTLRARGRRDVQR